MKRILLITIIFIALSVAASAQTCPAGQVCISQETANRLFNTVEQLIEAKNALNRLLAERNASDATIAAANKVIEGYKQLETVNGLIDMKKDQIISLYEKTLQMYAALTEKLEKQISKPKSAWSKFVDALKSLAYILAGAAIGRGL